MERACKECLEVCREPGVPVEGVGAGAGVYVERAEPDEGADEDAGRTRANTGIFRLDFEDMRVEALTIPGAEVDRLIASFLDGLGPEGRRQLIFTTHEIQLMRADLLRRDENWVADKIDGQSELTRVSDYADVGVRKDADLLGFYMSGRIGGVLLS